MANIILTGGNQGIGYFMAEKFLQNGDCVAVLDLENDNLRELKKEYPGRLLDCICDMRGRRRRCRNGEPDRSFLSDHRYCDP